MATLPRVFFCSLVMMMVVFSAANPGLSPFFYDASCPQANDIVMSVLERAIAEDPRMAASLLRLHFHDCFVQGCDASILLDKTSGMASEKDAGPNKNSIRGIEVVDEIKAELEQVCPHTVSCADILALAARDSTVLASMSKTSSLFRQRLYNQNGDNQPDATLERAYYNDLKAACPKTGGDNNVSPLDVASPVRFDNTYFKLLLRRKGLLASDEALLTGDVQKTVELVKGYASDEELFFHHFAKSMVKMGNINPLVGLEGEIRHNCHHVN
nr:peroxidase 9 [Ipomoea batatas]